MKTLKFTTGLCEQILSGEKTSTWRLFDDKDLSIGDELEFLNKETGEPIGKAVIDFLKVTSLGSLEASDWEGHETYVTEEDMYAMYRTYYGDKVGPESELKIIHFIFTTK